MNMLNFKLLIFNVCVLVIAAGLQGCAVNQVSEQGPLYKYRADLAIQLGSSTYDGMAVTKADGGTTIGFTSPVGIDRVQITTCARQAVCQSGGACDPNFQINRDWLGNVKNSFSFNYQPVPAELEQGCPMYIESYSKSNLTSWGFVAFRTDEAMPAHSFCNGQGVHYAGITVCQSKAGLEQTMTFDEPVKAIAEPSCHMSTADAKSYKLKPEMGFCRATFAKQAPDKKLVFHRGIFLGFDGVLVRVN